MGTVISIFSEIHTSAVWILCGGVT